MKRRQRVLLLFGGRSAEHDVSRVTAVAVARALDRTRYDVVPVAITTDGRWLLADSAQRAIDGGLDAIPSAFEVDGDLAPAVGALDVDVVFPLLHGPYGEDGTVQGLLELADLPYVGSGVLGSAVAMDKVMMKRAFAATGLPYATTVEFRDGNDRDALVERVEQELGYPCFVKPANLGSSVGVSKAHDRAELVDAVDVALGYDEWIVVEAAIAGREIELGVLGDDPPDGLAPGRDRARRRVLLVRRQVRSRRRPAPGARAPGRRPGRRGAGVGGARVRGLSLRGDGAGRSLPRATSTARSW